MVTLHRMDHVARLAVLAQQLTAKLEVGAIHLPVHRFPDIVQQAGTLCDLGVAPKLGRHMVAQPTDLHRVFESILPVR